MHWILCRLAAYYGPHYPSEDFRSLARGPFQHLLVKPNRLYLVLVGVPGSCRAGFRISGVRPEISEVFHCASTVTAPDHWPFAVGPFVIWAKTSEVWRGPYLPLVPRRRASSHANPIRPASVMAGWALAQRTARSALRNCSTRWAVSNGGVTD